MELWWVFPIAIVFSTVAIGSGVSGALFFSPFFMLVEYPTCWRPPGVALAAVGGLLTGMISAGLPEISTTQLVVRCRMPPRVAIATSVFTLAIVAAVGATVHALNAEPAWQVVGWSIPGVLLGSTVGSRVGRHLPGPLMEKVLGVVFGAVGILVLALEFGV